LKTRVSEEKDFVFIKQISKFHSPSTYKGIVRVFPAFAENASANLIDVMAIAPNASTICRNA
jgi:hypothetical protein